MASIISNNISAEKSCNLNNMIHIHSVLNVRILLELQTSLYTNQGAEVRVQFIDLCLDPIHQEYSHLDFPILHLWLISQRKKKFLAIFVGMHKHSLNLTLILPNVLIDKLVVKDVEDHFHSPWCSNTYLFVLLCWDSKNNKKNRKCLECDMNKDLILCNIL